MKTKQNKNEMKKKTQRILKYVLFKNECKILFNNLVVMELILLSFVYCIEDVEKTNRIHHDCNKNENKIKTEM